MKGILHNKRKGKVTQSRVGPLPPSVLVAHSMEDRVPHGSFDVGPHVFVEAFSRAAVMPSDFKRFSYLQVVGQFSLVFICHVGNDFRLPKDIFLTCLFMLSYAGVLPVSFLGRFFVFLPAG